MDDKGDRADEVVVEVVLESGADSAHQGWDARLHTSM